MANDFLAPPRRRPYVVAAVVATLIAGISVMLFTRHDAQPSTANTHNASPPQPAVSASRSPASTSQDTVGVGSIVLVRGAALVNGVNVGYPHTEVGAVSAAVEYLSLACSTLDPDRAAAVGRLTGDGSPGAAPEDFAQGPVNTRRWLGLPLTGPLPPTASVILGPVAFQLRDSSPNRALVLLLGYLTTSSPQQAMVSRLGVFPVLMVWHDDDWKISRRADITTDYHPLIAQPGSLQAVQLGWREMTR